MANKYAPMDEKSKLGCPQCQKNRGAIYRPIFHLKSLWTPYCKEYLKKYYKRPNEDLVKLIKLYKWPLLEFENTKRSQSYDDFLEKIGKVLEN